MLRPTNASLNAGASTAAGYAVVARHIRGPILVGDAEQRAAHPADGRVPKRARLLPIPASRRRRRSTG